MGNFFRHLWVLMWKHVMVRREKKLNFLFELNLPLTLFIWLFLMRHDLEDIINNTIHHYKSIFQQNVTLLGSNDTISRLLYSPYTPSTRSLMANVGKRLNITELEVDNIDHNIVGYWTASKEYMKEFSRQMKYDEAIIIFHMDEEYLLEQGAWRRSLELRADGIRNARTIRESSKNSTVLKSHSDQFNYTIRMKKKFLTGTVTNSFLQPYDIRMPNEGSIYNNFVKLQWAVDQAYLTERTGAPVEVNLTLKKFPRPKDDCVNVTNLVIIYFIKLATLISLLAPFVLVVSRLLEERLNGVQELMKTMGVTSTILGVSHFLNCLPSVIEYGAVSGILLTASQTPMLAHTSPVIVFIALSLYYANIIAFAFVTSYIPNSKVGKMEPGQLNVLSKARSVMLVRLIKTHENYSLMITVIIFITVLGIRFYLRSVTSMSTAVSYLSGLIIHSPIDWFWDEVLEHEIYCQGVDFSNLFEKQSTASAGVCLVYMVLQIFILFCLTWYLDKVRPGPYTVSRPWNFLCLKQYWSKEDHEIIYEEFDEPQNSEYFEEAPKSLKPGIQIVNLTKVFKTSNEPKKTALSNLTLNIYQREITVLLGHNGAGKTTLISIITGNFQIIINFLIEQNYAEIMKTAAEKSTLGDNLRMRIEMTFLRTFSNVEERYLVIGMLKPTNGNVYINGVDISKDLDRVRRDLGLCPQENLNFPDLSLQQHIILFSMLKRMSYKQAKEDSLKLIKRLKLEKIQDFKSSELSGGMRKRLQLACALAGDANVIILDEPTSGLDVETRRELWDILLDLRGERTVLLTTHFMEEADALGDRVAAIHDGKLKCNASPMFLKQALGTGYRLSLTVKKTANVREITNLIINHVPEVKLYDHTYSTLIYRLPAKANKEFSKLFNELEVKRQDLEIETIGVGLTTLDEVFIKLCSEITLTDIEEVNLTQIKETEPPKIEGVFLYLRIIRILLKRQLKATRSKLWIFLFIQCITPIALILYFTFLNDGEPNQSDNHNPPTAMNLDLYSKSGRYDVFVRLKNTSNLLRTLNEDYPNITFVQSFDISKDVLRNKTNTTEYKKYLVGIDSNRSTVYVSTALRHTIPAVVNLFSNILATTLLRQSDNLKIINTFNHPIEDVLRTDENILNPKNIINYLYWSMPITFLLLGSLVNEVNLPCREKAQGSRHFQIMSGCPPFLYWMVTFMYDLILPMFGLLPAMVIGCFVFEQERTIDRMDFLVSLYIFLLVGVIAFLLFIYIMSFIFKEGAAVVIIYILTIIYVFVVCPGIYLSFYSTEEKIGATEEFFESISFLTPTYSIAMGVLKLSMGARLNAYCHLNKNHCPDIPIIYNFDSIQCCESKSDWGPFAYFEKDRGDYELRVLTTHIIVYFILLLMIEHGIVTSIECKIINYWYTPPPREFSDEMATNESKYVENNINQCPPEAAIMAHNLHKKYLNTSFRPIAVRGISFHVKKGECFGLLGVNGAGKSTTFKMMTGESGITRGNVYANGYYLKKQRSKYLYSLGYCPQFGGVDPFLTGAENLEVLLTIRGLNSDEIKDEVMTWIKCVGLEQYANRQVSGYSGGCARRLAAAAALAASAPVCVLDEPTSGVDVSARRRVWAALKRGLAHHSAVIVASHSMDEMEMLSNRIAIMSNGEICTMGTPAALRAHHATGYTVRIKLKVRYYKGSGPGAPGHEIREEIESNFVAVLRDQYQTMLNYHITNEVSYSRLFSFLERLKENYRYMVEDYSVTENTLEEVFLSFVRRSKPA